MTTPSRHIVIIGGGIIGCTTAFYLSTHSLYNSALIRITLLEASSVAGGASGKAGGLLARWAYPSALAVLSLAEHKLLAGKYGGADKWGYREIECGEWSGRGQISSQGSYSATESPKSLEKAKGLHQESNKIGDEILPSDLDWIRSHLTSSYTPMSIPCAGYTAQVHPYQFTTSILELAKANGVNVTYGRVTSINYTEDDRVNGVTYVPALDPNASSEHASEQQKSKEIFLEATDVLVAAGPWSSRIVSSLPIEPICAHSITIRPSHPVSAYALFTSITLPSVTTAGESRVVNPEIYARPNNEVYVCSGGDSPPLPDTTADVKVDASVCDDLFQQAASISDELAQGEVTVKQACFLSITQNPPRGFPIIGAVPNKPGLYVATGHTCWGINNAPGTAKCISELIMDGRMTSAKLDRLAPQAF